MRKTVLICVAGCLLVSSIALAQEKFEKKNAFGVNPLGLLFKIYSGEYSRFLGTGESEVNVPFFYWAPLDELTILGAGGKYRMYKDGNAEGIFYGGGLVFYSVSWDYTSTVFSGTGFRTQTESVTGITITPQLEGGYRWRWQSGFTLAPSLTLGYVIGSVKASDGSVSEFGSAGFSWGLNLGLAYMF